MTPGWRQDAAEICAIGLGACLLFQIQFLLAREILPWFGGAAAVWSTSLVVFQALLLAGYAWAHGLARIASRRRQVGLQVALVTSALALLAWRAATWPSPVTPADTWKPTGDASPILAITTLLIAAVGVPFVVLASASPLVQRWRADSRPHDSPYRLYAASNAGSLAGLLSYPLLIEPRLDIFQQGRWWAIAYVAFAAAMLVCAGAIREIPGQGLSPDGPGRDRPLGAEALAHPSRIDYLLWWLLAAVPAALLQATTTLLTQDIAAVPFLWIVPLALYLLTYIVAFERPAACSRPPLSLLLATGALLSLWRWPTPVALALALVTMVMVGLVLHGELARRAPAPAALTRYYLAIAAGGVAGSALVAFGAPLAFTRIVEYPAAIAVALFLVSAITFADARSRADRHNARGSTHRGRLLAEGLLLAGLVVIAATSAESQIMAEQVTHASRSFFGTVRVRDMTLPDGSLYRRFTHGTTMHGVQFLDEARRRTPTAYFTSASGIGLAMSALTGRAHPARVAVIGLGIGTLAAYGRRGDTFTFYEIDPQVVALSSGPAPVFTYLHDSAATVEVVVGDGRLALERAPALGADMVVMDAFSSDAVPVHLVTREAMALYARHLRDRRSVIAVNISNRFLALADIVAAGGAASGFAAVLVEGAAGPDLVHGTDWMLLSRDPEVLRPFGSLLQGRAEPWTDAWSDPWRVLRW